MGARAPSLPIPPIWADGYFLVTIGTAIYHIFFTFFYLGAGWIHGDTNIFSGLSRADQDPFVYISLDGQGYLLAEAQKIGAIGRLFWTPRATPMDTKTHQQLPNYLWICDGKRAVTNRMRLNKE